MSNLTDALSGFRVPMPDGVKIPVIDESMDAILRALAKNLKELADMDAGYPVAIEHDGSRWISLDWLLEKLPK